MVKVKAPADFFGPGAYPLAVSARFRDLIEAMEPGLHQFHPVELADHRGQLWPGDFFLARFAWASAVDVTRSDVGWYPLSGRPGHFLATRYPDNIVVNRAQAAGRHLWLNHPTPSGRSLYCSDEFLARCKAAKIVKLRFWPCEVTDAPWDPASTLPPDPVG